MYVRRSNNKHIPPSSPTACTRKTQKNHAIPSVNRMLLLTTNIHVSMASSTALKVDAKIKQLLMTGNIARAVRDGFAALLTRVQQLRAKRLNLHLKQQACVWSSI